MDSESGTTTAGPTPELGQLLPSLWPVGSRAGTDGSREPPGAVLGRTAQLPSVDPGGRSGSGCPGPLPVRSTTTAGPARTLSTSPPELQLQEASGWGSLAVGELHIFLCTGNSEHGLRRMQPSPGRSGVTSVACKRTISFLVCTFQPLSSLRSLEGEEQTCTPEGGESLATSDSSDGKVPKEGLRAAPKGDVWAHFCSINYAWWLW